ncbi:MAG: hypothetical protein ACPLW9_00720 [Minisyncoccales bacterium]
MIKNLILFLIIIGLLIPCLLWAEKEQTPAGPPQTLEETQNIGEKTLSFAEEGLWFSIKKIFYEEVLPVWQKIWLWFYSHIGIKIKNWFDLHIMPEVNKRIEIFKKRFLPEKEELKQEIKTEVPTWWQRLKEFFK